MALLLPIPIHHMSLVRSLAFPSLQPSLVRTFSPFPILLCTNRKQQTESGPPAEPNGSFSHAKAQSEYLLHF